MSFSNYTGCNCCSANPWPQVGIMHQQFLDIMINVLQGSSSSASGSGSQSITLAEFFDAFCTFLGELLSEGENIDPSNPLLQIACSIPPNTMNEYCGSGGLQGYNGMQQSFINPPTRPRLKQSQERSGRGCLTLSIFREQRQKTVHRSTQNNLLRFLLKNSLCWAASTTCPVNAIENRLLDIEEKLAESSMTIEEKTPLFMALSVGSNDLIYWKETLNNPGLWAPFLDSNYAVNYAELPFWVGASMEGALIYANRDQPNLVLPSTLFNASVDTFAVTLASVALVSGKVIFGWLPKVKG